VVAAGRAFLMLRCREEVHDLSYADATRLDILIKQSYEQFIDNSPESWKEDGFFTGRKPVAVTCRFGQNLQIGTRGQEEREGLAFEDYCDVSQVQYLSFALATDLG
jgi:hypothetical protein